MAKREDYLSNEYTENDKRLIKIFQEEVMRLDMLYYRAINSNQKDKAQELLSKIKRVVKELKSSYDDWANVEIPKEYLKGATYINDSINGEDGLKVVLEADEKEVRGMIKTLGPAHLEAVNALLNTSKNYVKSSLDGMERQAISMLGELQGEKVREELAKGTLLGESLATMEERIKRYFQKNKISGFKDRAGRLWSIDRYVDMLVRTETSIANIQGTINRAIQLGHTKFKVVEARDCCEMCAEENGKVVDVRDGVVDLPPFHPNCRGYIISVMEDGTERQIGDKDIQEIKPNNPEERIEKSLDIIENSTMDLRYEQASFIDMDGNIIRTFSGKKNKCYIDDSGIKKPFILTHNHPNASSFSMQDLRTWEGNDYLREIRASGKLGTYSVKAERKIDKVLFIQKYYKNEEIAHSKAMNDMRGIVKEWLGSKGTMTLKDGTVITIKDNFAEYVKIADEHYWKYFREELIKASDDTPGVKFEFIPSDGIKKDTLLNKQYLEKIAELKKNKKSFEDNIELNNLI